MSMGTQDMVEAPDVLVVGGRGMLGTDIVHAVGETGKKALGLDIDSVDIRDPAGVIHLPVPKILINCAAYTNVDKAEEEKEFSWAVNVKGVKNLIRFCRSHDIPIVHFSTAHVFGGRKEAYDEEDTPDPVNHYGRTKAESEEVVRTWEKHWIVRTCWRFGHAGENFVDTVLDAEGVVKVPDDQRGSPTYTWDLARAVIRLLDAPYGTYHLANEGVTTRYGFAEEIKRQAGLDVEVEACSSDDMESAPRPKSAVLRNNKAEKLRHWKEALRAYLEKK